MAEILAVFGTRPEAIKLAPVLLALRESRTITVKVCVTGQHRELLHTVLRLFDITPDIDLDLMRPNQSLDDLAADVLSGVGRVVDATKPSLVLVQGDTTSMMATSLSAFHRRVPVAHVEAGLRSHDVHAPWPEELNRRVASMTARFHFAPTAQARRNLLAEAVPDAHIHVTGNTVIDALRWVAERIETSDRKASLAKMFPQLESGRRVILVTGHRRENFGDRMRDICRAIRRIAKRGDAQIAFVIHPNPNVASVVRAELTDVDRVSLIDPLYYEPFVYLMNRASIILTDSGGIQEEGPALGKPVLVMRDVTERPEAVSAGTARLVGASVERIVAEIERLLDDQDAYAAIAPRREPVRGRIGGAAHPRDPGTRAVNYRLEASC